MTTNTARTNNFVSLRSVNSQGFSVSISIYNCSVNNCITVV